MTDATDIIELVNAIIEFHDNILLLSRLRDLGLVITAPLITPLLTPAEARLPDAHSRLMQRRCDALGGHEAVLDTFREVDDVVDALLERGCPMHIIWQARGPWSPYEYGFTRGCDCD
jgi:hypothetical protein